ncbi:hypothetical protein D3C79_945920 [compost metagenome]
MRLDINLNTCFLLIFGSQLLQRFRNFNLELEYLYRDILLRCIGRRRRARVSRLVRCVAAFLLVPGRTACS